MPTSTPPPATTPLLLRAAGVLAAVSAATTLAACGGASGGSVAVTSTVVRTSTAPPSSIAPVSEAPISPTGEVAEVAAPDNTCPYISNDDARAAEGSRVGRVTLTTTTPPGCNFYFQYDDSQMILQIDVTNYPSQTGAYNAMIRDTVAAPERIGVQGLVEQAGCTAETPQDQRPTACLDAVLFRTTFNPADGNRDWAAAFAKNSRVITVKTQQDDVSFNAKSIAMQIAPKF